MNILITGGLGHIGTYILDNINKINNIKKIFVVDNNINNKINYLFYKKNNFNFILEDLRNKNALDKIKDEINIIIHLASITNAEESFESKKKVEFNNYEAFKNVVFFAIKKESKLIHISSTSVYGSDDNIVDEDCKELVPQSPYAKIKLKEERYLLNLKKIRFITLRFATIVGFSQGMRFHTAVNKFCFNTIFNYPITVWATAINQFRPYLSIKDSFKVIKYIIDKNYFDNKIHNIYSNNYTVKQIVNFIKKNKKRIKIKYVNSKIMNRLSYKTITKTYLRNQAKLSNKIQSDIKDIFKAFRGIV